MRARLTSSTRLHKEELRLSFQRRANVAVEEAEDLTKIDEFSVNTIDLTLKTMCQQDDGAAVQRVVIAELSELLQLQ